MPDDLELTLYGGGTLILDEAGRLKYHVRNRIRNAKRQDARLKYLWQQGSLNGRKSFAALHLERVLRRDVAAAPETHSHEEDHADPAI
jgi:hypothetical protein